MNRPTIRRHNRACTRRRVAMAAVGALGVAVAGGTCPALASGTAAAATTTTTRAAAVNGDILLTINGNLYLIKPNGTNLRRLTTGGRIADAEFSPDGTRIAFHKKLADGKQYLFVRKVAGGGLVKLGPGTNPSWSPDGNRLAFIDSRGVSVRSVRAGAPSVVLVPNVPGDYGVTYTDVDWARAGGRMAVTRWYYSYEHYVVAVDEVSDRTGARLRRHYSSSDPEFSRDGRTLAIQRNYRYDGPLEGIDLIDVSTGAKTELTSWEDDRRTITPVWSPDGTRLAVRETTPDWPETYPLDLKTISTTDGEVIATLLSGSSTRSIIPRDWRTAR